MEKKWKLVQTYSGDWALIPESVNQADFAEDEVNGVITNYAHFVEIENL